MKRGTDWTKDLPSCPCTLTCTTGLSGGPQNPDSNVWEDPSSWLWGYHKGAKWCMRSKSTGTSEKPKPGQQCCYDKGGKLLTHGEGAGTPDLISPGDLNFEAGGHQEVDVTPADLALKLDKCYPNANPKYILRLSFPKTPSGECTSGKATRRIGWRREKMATQKQMIARGSGCSIITAGPVATNRPFKPMPTITQHASIDDAIRRPAQWR